MQFNLADGKQFKCQNSSISNNSVQRMYRVSMEKQLHFKQFSLVWVMQFKYQNSSILNKSV